MMSAALGKQASSHTRTTSAGADRRPGRPSIDELLEDLDHIPAADAAPTTSAASGAHDSAARPAMAKAASMNAGSGTRQKCLTLWVSGSSNKVRCGFKRPFQC